MATNLYAQGAGTLSSGITWTTVADGSGDTVSMSTITAAGTGTDGYMLYANGCEVDIDMDFTARGLRCATAGSFLHLLMIQTGL